MIYLMSFSLDDVKEILILLEKSPEFNKKLCLYIF